MDALIFDFDGLIVDTEWPAYVTAADECASLGVELSIEAWQSRIGRGDNGPWTELLAGVVDDRDHHAIDVRRRDRKNRLTDEQPVLPGVEALLDSAEAHGLVAAVASSSPSSWVERHLELRGLRGRFSVVRTRDHVARTKPWPDLFLAAASALDVAPARAIVLEDSVHGVTAAKDAGMFCVAVPNRITAGGDFSRADLVVESLCEVDLGTLLTDGSATARL